MAKAVLISIRPDWVAKILSGEKTLEVRRTRPKLETPFKGYIYCTHNGGRLANLEGSLNGKVVAEFVCDRIDCVDIPYPAFMGKLDKHWMDDSCHTYWQLHRYFYHDNAYFWHISGLKIYDTPKMLHEFTGLRMGRFGAAPADITKPPQSWYYVEGLEGECNDD